MKNELLIKFSNGVALELTEMKKLGIKVPAKALALAKDIEAMQEYENMSISDCASLLIQLF